MGGATTTLRLVTTARWAGRASAAGAAVVGYVVVGYPGLVVLLGRVLPARAARPASLPPLSVVIAAHDEAGSIGPKLTSVQRSTYPPELVEVVVSDDGSTDGTADVVRSRMPAAHVVGDGTRAGKAVALNRGVAVATGEVIVFSDAENLLDPHALERVVAPFADPRVGAVNGRVVMSGGGEDVSRGERLYWAYEDAVRRGEARVGSLTGASGALLAVRRELVPELPPGLVNDDFFLAMHVARQGRRVDYAPEAITTEFSAGSLHDEQVRRRRINAGRWQSLRQWRMFLPLGNPVVLWQVVSHKYLRLALPFAMGAALAGSAVQVAALRAAGRRTGGAGAFLALQAGGYLVAAAAPAVPQRLGPVRAAAMALRYVVVSSATAAQGLRQALTRPDQLHLWQRVTKELHPDE